MKAIILILLALTITACTPEEKNKMTYSPIAFTAPNYRDFGGYWLKAYEPGTTTPKYMSNDKDGTTLSSKYEIGPSGFFISAGSTILTPYISGSFDLWLFPTEQDADLNNTINAVRIADNLGIYIPPEVPKYYSSITEAASDAAIIENDTIFVQDEGVETSTWLTVDSSLVVEYGVNAVRSTSNPSLTLLKSGVWRNGQSYEAGVSVVIDPLSNQKYVCLRSHTVPANNSSELVNWVDDNPPYWAKTDNNELHLAKNRSAKHILEQVVVATNNTNTIDTDFYPDSRSIVLLGDSHSWGEGSDSYEGSYDSAISNTIHAPTITSEGYYKKLTRFIKEKLGTSHRKAEVLYGDSLVQKTGTTANKVLNYDATTETQEPRVLSGSYRRWESMTPIKNSSLFAGARKRGDTYSKDTYRYLTEQTSFDSSFLQIGQSSGSGDAVMIIDVPEPVNMFNLGLSHFRDTGAIIKVEFLSSVMPDDYDTSGGVNNIVDPYFTEVGIQLLKTGTPQVDFNPERLLTDNSANSMYTVNESTRSFTIDTSITDNTSDSAQFYPHIVRTFRKFSGKIRISIVGNGVNYTTPGTFGGSDYYFNGLLLNNNDQIKNWSMGGHTTGAMIGFEASFFGETRNHLNDLVKYTYNDPQLLVFQLPYVNERLKGTTPSELKTNLRIVIDSIGAKNTILFTTIGRNDEEYPSSSSNVGKLKIAEYDSVVKELSEERDDITFINTRLHLRGLVDSGVLKESDLFYNNGHPSPRANQILYNYIKSAVEYSL